MFNFQHPQMLLILLSSVIIMQGCTPPKKSTHESKKTDELIIQGSGLSTTNDKRESPRPQPESVKTVDRVKAGNLIQSEKISSPEKNIHYTTLPSSVAAEKSYVPQRYYAQESYSPTVENSFISTSNDSLSTFSIDVDTGSYANIRRWLSTGQKVPVGAVRIEEMLNYFNYDYPEPDVGPVVITAEAGPCPWQPEHTIAKIGIKAKEIENKNLPASNLVFLIDVSGSMNQAGKLPLVKKALKMLVNQLTAHDRISIVVYAGSNRIVLPPTAGHQKVIIQQAIAQLTSGGSTHGSAGIVSAYSLAHQHFIPEGNNRIILASDGDFNVGITSRGELVRLIETQRQKGIFLTVLGFGNGNYKDDTMELLADKGNGNYSYIDSLLEAKKVLIKQRASTLFTVAKDVKLQIEFNPAKVGAYRLLGYENRLLADEDFINDKKDAGEIGVGHTVTALYELIPPGSPDLPSVAELKYRRIEPTTEHIDDLLTVRLRYKEPQGAASKSMSQTLIDSKISFAKTTDDFRFATAVAWFGMHLQKSDYVTAEKYAEIIDIANKSRGEDKNGLRAEFVKLVETAELLEN